MEELEIGEIRIYCEKKEKTVKNKDCLKCEHYKTSHCPHQNLTAFISGEPENNEGIDAATQKDVTEEELVEYIASNLSGEAVIFHYPIDAIPWPIHEAPSEGTPPPETTHFWWDNGIGNQHKGAEHREGEIIKFNTKYYKVIKKEKLHRGNINYLKKITLFWRNMRNPERIDKIIEIIQREWKKHPDLRLHQLLYIKEDPFYIEDYELLKHLAKKLGFKLDKDKLPEYWTGENPWKNIHETADKLTEKKKIRLTGKYKEKKYIP